MQLATSATARAKTGNAARREIAGPPLLVTAIDALAAKTMICITQIPVIIAAAAAVAMSNGRAQCRVAHTANTAHAMNAAKNALRMQCRHLPILRDT